MAMSPASKSKPKEKKAGKESQKASAKLSGAANARNGVPASAYNPLSGTFHVLESGPVCSSSPLHANGRFRNIEETDDHQGVGSGAKHDTFLNNGSWSGESEDHKEKTSNPPAQLEIPGADNDRREKIRLKNERKHQRQKERRALELHDKCRHYLMSRKLEALAQQLVAMGFSQDRATRALILNEGKIEESVSWLFEGKDDVEKPRDQIPLKINVSEELAQIAEFESRYKCTKLEVERTVVACEGDLEKAAESLRSLKLDPPSVRPKPEEAGDSPIVTNSMLSLTACQNTSRSQPKHFAPFMLQQRRDEREFNYAKASLPLIGSSEPGKKGLQALKRIQQKMEWVNPQQTVVTTEQRWPIAGANPSASYPLASSQVIPQPVKAETRFYPPGGEYTSFQHGFVREPVIMMQRPQSANSKQIPATSSSTPDAAFGWYPTNSMMPQITRGLGRHIPNTSQMFHHLHYQQQPQPQPHFVPNNTAMDSPSISRGMGLSTNGTGSSPTLAAASSLGLFSRSTSNVCSGRSLPVDWSTAGSMTNFDYTNIDWSLDQSRLDRSLTYPIGSVSTAKNSHVYNASNSNLGAKLATRFAPAANGMPVPMFQEGFNEWHSPFEEKDLFSLPRQFVSPPPQGRLNTNISPLN